MKKEHPSANQRNSLVPKNKRKRAWQNECVRAEQGPQYTGANKNS
jgi:hypothetical protein